MNSVMLTKGQLALLNAIASMAKGSGITEGKNGGEGFMGSFVDQNGKTHCFKLLTHSNERKEAFKGKTEDDVLNANTNLKTASDSLKDDLLSLARSVGLEDNIRDLLNSDKNKSKVLMGRKIVAQIAGRIGEAHNKLVRAAGQMKGEHRELFDWDAVTRARTEGNSSLTAKFWALNSHKFSAAECKLFEKFPNLSQSICVAFSTEKIAVPKIEEHRFEPLRELPKALEANKKEELARISGMVTDKTKAAMELRRTTLAGSVSNVKIALGIKDSSIRRIAEISDEDLKNPSIDKLYTDILKRGVVNKYKKAIEAEEGKFFIDNSAVIDDYRKFFSAIGKKMDELRMKCKSKEKIKGLGTEEKRALAKLAFAVMSARGLPVENMFKQKGLEKVLDRFINETTIVQSRLNEDDGLKSDKEGADVASRMFAVGAIIHVNAALAEGAKG